MTNETTAVTAPHDDAAGASAAPPTGGGALAVLALLWLAATLWSAQAAIGATRIGTGAVVNDITVTSSALALPGVIAASLIAGAAVGLTTISLYARWRAAGRVGPGARVGAGTAGGVLTAAFAALPIGLNYAGLPSITVLTAAVAVAALVGGALAGLRPLLGAAGVAGALGAFAVGFVLNAFSPTLMRWFGAGESEVSRISANAWLALTTAVLSGLLAGGLAYAYLRRRGFSARWPAYLLAGALPGLLILLAEVVTRVGGAPLFALAGAISDSDSTALTYLGSARINRALIVLFVGALTATVAYGRSLPSPDRERERDGGAGTA